MMASAFAMLASTAYKKSPAPESELPATVEQAENEFDYTISNIGENYKKSTVYSDHGRHTGGLGLSAWWGQEEWGSKTRFYRNYYYGDLVVRDKYPFVVGYNPYSDWAPTGPSVGPQLSFTTHSFYRISGTGLNVVGLGTGANKDPGVLPILLPGGLASDGGNPQMWLYGTYLSYQECKDIKAGTHYANTYYQVPAGVVDVQAGSAYYDGWWWELQGRIQFDRASANKFLGLSLAAPDLRTEFTTKNAGNALGNAWNDEWRAEGSTGGYANVYAAYDYTIDYGPSWLYLSLDAGNSNANSISVLMWSGSQGEEALLMRFLDIAGVRHNLMPYYEDYYLNLTLHPTYGDMEERLTTVYHMTAWKDTSFFSPSWMIEGQHADYTADDGMPPDIPPTDWVSFFDPYFWGYYDASYGPTRLSYSPGQSTFNTRVQYWQTPMDWNLTDGETLRIVLPTNMPGWGILPYWDATVVFGDAELAQLNSHGVWGEWVLGRGTPAWYYSPTYYDSATKTLTFDGPLTMDKVMNPLYDIFETGSPKVLIDISKVSQYELTLQGNPSPIVAGQEYTLVVTPLNFTGAAAACNQTVELPAVAGVTYGASEHTFLTSEASWTTKVVFGSGGTYNLQSRDKVFTLDISDTYQFVVVPPTGFQLNLVTGWNLVTVPPVGYGYTASMLGGIVDQVATWDPLTKAYTIWWSFFPEENDFAIQGSTGYWVLATAPGTLTLLGDIPTTPQTRAISVPSGGGWAIVGFNSLRTDWTASDVVTMYTGGVVDQVATWDPVAKGYTIWWSFFPDENDFALVPGQGYWVLLTASGALSYTP